MKVKKKSQTHDIRLQKEKQNIAPHGTQIKVYASSYEFRVMLKQCAKKLFKKKILQSITTNKINTNKKRMTMPGGRQMQDNGRMIDAMVHYAESAVINMHYSHC